MKEVHQSILNRPRKILALRECGRGLLIVDVGESRFGQHRISISTILHISGQNGDPEIRAEMYYAGNMFVSGLVVFTYLWTAYKFLALYTLAFANKKVQIIKNAITKFPD